MCRYRLELLRGRRCHKPATSDSKQETVIFNSSKDLLWKDLSILTLCSGRLTMSCWSIVSRPEFRKLVVLLMDSFAPLHTVLIVSKPLFINLGP